MTRGSGRRDGLRQALLLGGLTGQVRGAVAQCGALGAALVLVVARAHLRTPVADVGVPARADVAGVEG